jgi:hypothetical protein
MILALLLVFSLYIGLAPAAFNKDLSTAMESMENLGI